MSLQESGITETVNNMNHLQPSWEDDTDDFLKSMLNGPDLSSQLESVCPSDTSSDSGCPDDRVRMLASPGLDDDHYSPSSFVTPDSPSVDLVDYISNDDSDTNHGEVVSPVTLIQSTDPELSTGTTTIILPIVQPQHTTVPVSVTPLRLAPRDQAAPAAKRRRVSASSSDSGLEDSVVTMTQTTFRHSDNKYPALELNDEELKMAAKENMKFPSHYPLTREEERNLKKIRRKIRNKLSAQDSRKRKREYLDNMEDRVKAASDENQELQEKIKALESQNKTLAAQLRRLHQIVVNGGLRQGQTSTALMALLLIPGLGDKADSKNEIDIQSALKMPPMPGQSRSLLQFEGIERGANDIADMTDFQELKSEAEEVVEVKLEAGSSPPYSDHDYTFKYKYIDPMKTESGSAWIEEDAPPLGYGPAVKTEEEVERAAVGDLNVVDMNVAVDRHMNVNVTSSG